MVKITEMMEKSFGETTSATKMDLISAETVLDSAVKDSAVKKSDSTDSAATDSTDSAATDSTRFRCADTVTILLWKR